MEGWSRRTNDKAGITRIGFAIASVNQNTRQWARAALWRKTGQDFKQDKEAWAKRWDFQGNKPIDGTFLEPWGMPPQAEE